MRIIDADELLKEWCEDWCLPKPNCQEDCAIYDAIKQMPTIRTKCIKYYDEDESVWKIGEVIVDE